MVALIRYLPVQVLDLVYRVTRKVPLLEEGKRNAQLGTGRVGLAYCQRRYAETVTTAARKLFCLSFSQMAMSGSEQQKHAAFSVLTVLFSSLLCTYVLFPLKLSRSQKWQLQQFPVTSNNFCFHSEESALSFMQLFLFSLAENYVKME